MKRQGEGTMRISEVRFLVLLLLAAGIVPSAAAQVTVGSMTLSTAKMTGTSVIGGGSSPICTTIPVPSLKPDYDLVEARRNSVANHAVSNAGTLSAALAIPAPRPNAVTNHGANVGFKGLTTVDTANTNGFVTTPPDQGMCAGHGFVLEMINVSMAVYSTTGTQLTVPASVNAFFGADPNTTFRSDPRCYYDTPTQRWFASITNVYNSTTGRSNLFLAVSLTSDPRGAFYIYSIDTTDDGLNGTPNNPGCTTTCFGDQPLLGADAY